LGLKPKNNEAVTILQLKAGGNLENPPYQTRSYVLSRGVFSNAAIAFFDF
jgi:hypothetical protein